MSKSFFVFLSQTKSNQRSFLKDKTKSSLCFPALDCVPECSRRWDPHLFFFGCWFKHVVDGDCGETDCRTKTRRTKHIDCVQFSNHWSFYQLWIQYFLPSIFYINFNMLNCTSLFMFIWNILLLKVISCVCSSLFTWCLLLCQSFNWLWIMGSIMFYY